MKAFTDALEKAKKKRFSEICGGKMLHLRILGTYPDCQGRSAGIQHYR